jgi:lipopolysaccharide biosynthesis protein
MARGLILAHHDRHGVVDDHVVAAIHAYRAVADYLVVVSTSARALPDTVAPLVDRFIPRPNEGYDFCSWRAGIGALGEAEACDELICVNDSVYGPLADLGSTLGNSRLANVDFGGMCLSTQDPAGGSAPRPHVQSWFLIFRRPVLESDAFRVFWEGVVPLDRKRDIVERYEIGLSERLVEAGFRMGALYDQREHGPATLAEMLPHLSWRSPGRSFRHLRKARRAAHNPSELHWRRLLEAGVPFAKVSLFMPNHYGLDRNVILRGLAAQTSYDWRLIERHLHRLTSGL